MKLTWICVLAVWILPYYVDGRPPAAHDEKLNEALAEFLRESFDGESVARNNADENMDAFLEQLEKSRVEASERIALDADGIIDRDIDVSDEVGGGSGTTDEDDRSLERLWEDLGMQNDAETFDDTSTDIVGETDVAANDVGDNDEDGTDDTDSGIGSDETVGRDSSLEELERALAEIEADSDDISTDVDIRKGYRGDEADAGENASNYVNDATDNTESAVQDSSLQQLQRELDAYTSSESAGDDTSLGRAMEELEDMASLDAIALGGTENYNGYAGDGYSRSQYSSTGSDSASYSVSSSGDSSLQRAMGELADMEAADGDTSVDSSVSHDTGSGSASFSLSSAEDSSLERAIRQLAELDDTDESTESGTGFVGFDGRDFEESGGDSSIENLQAELDAISGGSRDDTSVEDSSLQSLQAQLDSITGSDAEVGANDITLEAIETELAAIERGARSGTLTKVPYGRAPTNNQIRQLDLTTGVYSTGTNAADPDGLFDLFKELGLGSQSSVGTSQNEFSSGIQNPITGRSSKSSIVLPPSHQQSSNSQMEYGNKLLQKYVEGLMSLF